MNESENTDTCQHFVTGKLSQSDMHIR